LESLQFNTSLKARNLKRKISDELMKKIEAESKSSKRFEM